MAYTGINKSTDYFNTKLYTGGSGDTAHTGVGFQPDLVWIKERTRTRNHALFDVIRGSRYWLGSNSADAQDYNSGAYLASLDSDGFTTTDTDVVGKNGYTYASWNWKANGAGVANTDGSINSTVSANTTSGFSIVSYTGNGTAGATVGHGLGAVPKMIIIKQYSSNGGTENWAVYHNKLGNTDALYLSATNSVVGSNYFWNNTTPSSTLITLGSGDHVNNNTVSYIAYCFAEKTGYSKFGSYVGNGNVDGTFVYTGFKPEFVLIKRSDGGDHWNIPVFTSEANGTVNTVSPNLNTAERTMNENPAIDYYSNGFKVKTVDANYNINNGNYIYMAIGQSLVGSNNVPCTAR